MAYFGRRPQRPGSVVTPQSQQPVPEDRPEERGRTRRAVRQARTDRNLRNERRAR